MTDPVPTEAAGYDDLAEAAEVERIGRLLGQRRLRAWLMSMTASAGLVLLALAAVSLMAGPHDRSTRPPSALPYPPGGLVVPTDPFAARFLAGALALATIPLPAGWSADPLSGLAAGTEADPVRWVTGWTAPNGVTDGPQVVAGVLTGQGWQRCAADGARTECWERSPYQLTLTWGPGERCPSTGPCSRASVVLFRPAPAPPTSQARPA